MAFYEVVFIVRPDVATTQVDQLTSRMAELITKQDGKVMKTENWGLRTLAYRVRKYKKGYYVMLGADLPGSAVAEIERNLKLADDVIRFHTIRVEEMDETPSVMMKFKARNFDADDNGDDAEMSA